MALDHETIINVAREAYDNVDTYVHRGQLSLIVHNNHLLEVCKTLRDNEQTLFDMCIDVTAIDWYDKKNPRFDVVIFLYSNAFKSRVRIKVGVSDKKPVCNSITSIWPSANYYERETYDMYGIKFEGHPNLRRFYMPENFNDPETGEPLHPLRKEFPLMGVPDSLPLPPYPEKYEDTEN